MPDPTLGDYAAIAGAAFTALAAFAALRTVRHGRQTIEAAESPRVEIQQLCDPSGYAGLSLINTGRGIARGVNFVVHRDGKASVGNVGDGFLRPDEGVHVETHVGPLPDPDATAGRIPGLAAMVAFRDAEAYVHYRTPAGDEYVPKTAIRRKPKYPDRREVITRFFPEVNLNSATSVPCSIRKR